MGLMEEESGGAKRLRFFQALILGVKWYQLNLLFPPHPAVYKSQVRVKSQI